MWKRWVGGPSNWRTSVSFEWVGWVIEEENSFNSREWEDYWLFPYLHFSSSNPRVNGIRITRGEETRLINVKAASNLISPHTTYHRPRRRRTSFAIDDLSRQPELRRRRRNHKQKLIFGSPPKPRQNISNIIHLLIKYYKRQGGRIYISRGERIKGIPWATYRGKRDPFHTPTCARERGWKCRYGNKICILNYCKSRKVSV